MHAQPYIGMGLGGLPLGPAAVARPRGLRAGLIAYYTFEDNGQPSLANVLGGGPDGELFGGEVMLPGAIGLATKSAFDGSVTFDYSGLTISQWISPAGTFASSTGGTLLWKNSFTNIDLGLTVHRQFYRWDVTVDDATVFSLSQSDGWSAGKEWRHGVVSCSPSGDIKLFVNGVLVYKGTDGTTTGRIDTLSTGSNTRVYADEVGVWNRQLSDEECLRLYNGGRGLPYPFV